MTAVLEPISGNTDRLAGYFRHFAKIECPEEPLYQALCDIVAASPALLDLLRDVPIEQQRPNLWLAAVHDFLLGGIDHPLANYFPSCGGTRAPDKELTNTVTAFALEHAPALRECMRTHSTQTNEVGRCAVLYPILQEIARRSDGRPLAMLDVGCSAGLNLGVDTYCYDYGEFSLGATAATGVPNVSCQLVGLHRPDLLAPRVQIVRRLGIDPFPINVNDERAVRWLRACLWPSDRARARRFDLAVALAQSLHWPVQREADCTAAVSDWLSTVPDDVQPVVFNSWVLTYFDPAALKRHIDTMTGLVKSRGAIWLSAEGAALTIGSAEVPPATQPNLGPGTLWTLCSRAHAEDQCKFEVLARSHPHGRWMEWLL